MKLATPPTSLRPSVRRASSTPTSKSSAWTQITSAPGDRREQRDLITRLHRMIESGVILVHRNLHGATIGQGCLISRALGRQPVQQIADSAHEGRRRQLLG